ncbi:MAG: hypothetical protein FWB78_12080, partial [Treponema sp.]|nr:hypothetical protein [Treponema sp.]
TLSAQFTPGGSDVAGVTFAWSVSPTGVLTYGAANANTFAITGEQEGSATVTLNVSGGRITGTLTASVDVTVKEPSPDDGTVFAAWSFPPTNFNAQSVAANSGTLSGGATLEFFYADGTTRGTLGHADRASVNVPNNNAGWWQPANLTGSLSVENSAGWVITINTTGYEDITFSAHQSSSNNGPRDFRLAYRIGDSGPWAVFEGEGTVTVQGDTGEMGQTFNNVSLPEAVNDQAVVQVRVWIASTAPRGTGSLTATGGNTSLNHIEFRGTSTDAGEPPIAAWNHTVAGARAYAGNWPATSGTLAMETNLEFFYANEHRATLGRNQEDRAAVNVPNNAGGWFPGTRPAEGTRVDVTVEESAGWVITLNTTGYEDIMFSAYQSSSNNGPKDFRLAYRIGRDGTWTVFGDAVTVTAQGDDGGSPQNPAPPSQTFDNVLLPSTVDNEAVVQVRVWITSNARRSDGVFHLDPAGGNTSMNYIVFTGTAIEQGAAR